MADHCRDIVVEIDYPDKDGQDDCVTLSYYADGSVEARTDQRGTEHTYAYDDAGQLSRDGISGDTQCISLDVSPPLV